MAGTHAGPSASTFSTSLHVLPLPWKRFSPCVFSLDFFSLHPVKLCPPPVPCGAGSRDAGGTAVHAHTPPLIFPPPHGALIILTNLHCLGLTS